MYNELAYTQKFILAYSKVGLVGFIRSLFGPRLSGLSGTKNLSGTKKVLYITNGNGWKRKKKVIQTHCYQGVNQRKSSWDFLIS